MVRSSPPFIGGWRKTGRTEIFQKGLQCRRWIRRIDYAVVIAGDGDNGRWIIPKWLVELIVVVLAFAKIINNVSKMKEE